MLFYLAGLTLSNQTHDFHHETGRSLKINEASFKQMAKKLHKLEQELNADTKLSQAQEHLAKVFGYIDFHQYTKKSKIIESTYFKPVQQIIHNQVLVENSKEIVKDIVNTHLDLDVNAKTVSIKMNDTLSRNDEPFQREIDLLTLFLLDWSFISDKKIITTLLNYVFSPQETYNAGAVTETDYSIYSMSWYEIENHSCFIIEQTDSM